MTTVTTPADTAPELYVGADVVAAYLSTSRRWVVEQARRGSLPAHRLPGSNRVRFLLSEVEAAIQAQWRVPS
jgi:excisionase family DNA binding protein